MTVLVRRLGLFINRHGRMLAQNMPALSCQEALPNKTLSQSTRLFTSLTSQPCSTVPILVRTNRFNLYQKRFKRKRASKQDDEADNEEDDDAELSNENPLLMEDLLSNTEDGSEYMTITISSLRLDTFCKTAFSMTRAKVEELFYKGDIYVNGDLPNKKSADINVGDEIDVVKSIDPENNKLINVRRAVILRLPDKASEHGRMKLDIQRWQNVQVESKNRK